MYTGKANRDTSKTLVSDDPCLCEQYELRHMHGACSPNLADIGDLRYLISLREMIV